MKNALYRMKKVTYSKWFLRFVRWGLGGLFVYAGVLKLSHPHAFAIQLETYGILPATLLDPVSWILPVIEILVGLATMLNLRGGAEVLGFLLIVFIAILGHALWSGLDVPCGCFSLEAVQHQYGIQLAIVRDLIMLAGTTLLLRRKYFSFR